MKKKRRKYKYGTKLNIETPEFALAQNDINVAKALDEGSSPLVNIMSAIGGLGMQYAGSNISGGEIDILKGLLTKMAYGGKVGNSPVEVEGEEVAESPNGDVVKFKGKKHEQGGIDVNLPNGTKVFSDRIKIKGETLAERKKKREKTLANINKQLSKGFDPLLEKTKKKIETNNTKAEEFDLQLQGLANQLNGTSGKLAYGTGPDPLLLDSSLFDLIESSTPQYLDNPQLKMYTPEIKRPGKVKDKGFDPIPLLIGLEGVKDDLLKVGSQAIGNMTEKSPNLTGGDMLGIGASLAQSILPLRNTLKERASNTLNENYFRDFGENSLKEIDNLEGSVKSIFESQIGKLDQSKRTQKAQNSLSARGVNTRRALDLASEQQYQGSYNQAIEQLYSQLMGVAQNKSNLLSKIDEMKMRGQEKADIANRQDKAAFYTQRGQDLISLTEGLQSVAGNLNQAEERDITTKLINTLYDKYGIEIDMKGNLKADKSKSKVGKKKTVKSKDDEFLSRLFGINTEVQNMNTNLEYGK